MTYPYYENYAANVVKVLMNDASMSKTDAIRVVKDLMDIGNLNDSDSIESIAEKIWDDKRIPENKRYIFKDTERLINHICQHFCYHGKRFYPWDFWVHVQDTDGSTIVSTYCGNDHLVFLKESGHLGDQVRWYRLGGTIDYAIFPEEQFWNDMLEGE